MSIITPVLVSAAFVAGTASAVHADVATAEVTFEIDNFYNPSKTINDSTLRVTAHNNTTGESFSTDRGGNVFELPPGNYTFSGRGQWCYLQPKTPDSTGDSDIVLVAGCE